MLTCDRYLEDAATNNGRYLGAVAFHLKVKSYYRNPVLYNFSYLESSNFFGISQSALRSYVKILLTKGIARFNGNNLQFAGTDTIKALYDTKRICHITIKKEDSISKIKDLIRVVLIKENQFEQQSIILKKEKEYAEKIRPETFYDKVHISLFGIGRLLGMTKSGAESFITRAKEGGLLSSRMVYKLIKSNVGANFDLTQLNKYSLGGFYRIHSGSLYLHKGQEYLIS